MLSDSKRKFLFKCQDCGLILSVDFEDEEDLQKVHDNKMILECPCHGKCVVLRD